MCSLVISVIVRAVDSILNEHRDAQCVGAKTIGRVECEWLEMGLCLLCVLPI